MTNNQRTGGFSLIEVLFVVALMAALMAVAGPQFLQSLNSENKVAETARQLLADIKTVQTDAMSHGGGDIANGIVIKRYVYVVFDTAKGTYQGYRYVDTDGNNIRSAGEVTAIAALKTLPNKVYFGVTPEVTSRACQNGPGAPATFVSYGSQVEPPCDAGTNCMQLDWRGFPSPNDGAIYITNGEHSYAISINSAGILRMCKWPKGGKEWIYTR